MAPVSSTQILTSTTEPAETVVAALAAERPGSPAADITPAVKATPEPGPIDKPAEKPNEAAAPKPNEPTPPPAKVDDPAAAPNPAPADTKPVEDDPDAILSPEEEASAAGRKLSSYRGAAKKRIDKLLKDRRERDEELARVKAELAKVKPVEDPAAVDPDDAPIEEPSIDNFDTVAEHTKALLEWDRKEQARKGRVEAKTKAKSEAAAAAEAANKTAYETMVSKFVVARDAAKERYADWNEVMESARNLLVADKPMLQAAIAESDLAGDLLYHFGQHPEVFDEIVALGPSKGLMKLGRIEDTIRARVGGLVVSSAPPAPVADVVPAATAAPPKPSTPPVPVSRAPEPMPSVGAGATSTAVDPNVMTHTQFKAWRAAGGGR